VHAVDTGSVVRCVGFDGSVVARKLSAFLRHRPDLGAVSLYAVRK
jgi:hypothetical protein